MASRKMFSFTLIFCFTFINLVYATKTTKICDVTKGSILFDDMNLAKASKQIENAFCSSGKYRFFSNQETEVTTRNSQIGLKYETGDTNHLLVDPKFGFKNAFIASALTAYNHHLPFELSPDDIWTLISFGVAQHIGGDNRTAENYRKVFVNHQGKKELKVRGDILGLQPENPEANKAAWPRIITALSNLIKNNTKTDVADIMTTPFSTSGLTEQTVFQCMLMDAMKNYFSYKLVLACGIPEITLHGTIPDWQSVVNRLDRLNGIFPDLVWYLDRVKADVLKFIDMLNGSPDLVWWNTMITSTPMGSGHGRRLSGWLADFFPYRFEGQRRYENFGEVDFDDLNSPAVSLTDFNLTLDSSLNEIKMKLSSGFLGVSQNKKTLAVRPVLGWLTYYVH